MKRRTIQDIILLRSLWLSVTVGLLAGLATLPSASAAHGAAAGHGFRSHPRDHHPYSHGHRSPYSRYHGRTYAPYTVPYYHYRDPNFSGFYWPRQNIYPAAVPSQGRIYVVPSPARARTSSGLQVRRIITINPSPFQEAGSAILNRPSELESEPGDDMDWFPDYDEDDALNLNFPDYSDPLFYGDDEQAWNFLREGRPDQALAAFSGLALAEPETMEHKLGYALAASMSGDKITAAYAWRIVYEKDVRSWMKPLSAENQEIVDTLMANYREGPRGVSVPNSDDLFVAGVLCHLRQAPSEGLAMVERARSIGDESASLQNLKLALRTTPTDPAPALATSK